MKRSLGFLLGCAVCLSAALAISPVSAHAQQPQSGSGNLVTDQNTLKIINDLKAQIESQEARIAEQQKLLQDQKRQLEELNRHLQPGAQPPSAPATPATPHTGASPAAVAVHEPADKKTEAAGYGGPTFADQVQEAVSPLLFHPKNLEVAVSKNTMFSLSGNARAYWRKYGPIMWSGLEDTFGAEGNVSPAIQVNNDNWSYGAYGNFQLNTPYDGNVLYTSNRAPYLNHFDIDPFAVDLLAVTIQSKKWGLEAGKVQTPYGSFHYQTMDNARWYGPFIRSEIIGYRELGFIGSFRTDGLKINVGPVNGTADLKSNSAKGIVGRLAYGREKWELGASGKWSGHLGSENQKEYQSFVGADAIYRFTENIALSGEFMMDWHGLMNPLPNPLPPPQYSGQYSFYGLDVYNNGDAIRGIGYYVNLDYRKYPWYVGLNFGSYFPEQINNAWHDETKNRGMLMGRWNMTKRLSLYGNLFLENINPNAPDPISTGKGFGYLLGLEIDL